MKKNTAKNMEEMKNMNVKFYEVKDDNAVFVKVAYNGCDGQAHTGLLLVDTGSNVNCVFGNMATDMELTLIPEEGGREVIGIKGSKERLQQVCLSFIMGEDVFNEPFLLMNQQIEKCLVGNLPVVGLLGNFFLQRYSLVVDYAEHTLHTSAIVPDDLKGKCDYLCSMYYGLRNYGIPVVLVKMKDNDIVTMVDTGSAENMISKVVLERNELLCSLRDEVCDITGIGGMVYGQKGKLEFDVLNFVSESQPTVRKYNDECMVVENHPLYAVERMGEEGKGVTPVEMLLGSKFLGRERWVLDFGIKAMYRLKGKQ